MWVSRREGNAGQDKMEGEIKLPRVRVRDQRIRSDR